MYMEKGRTCIYHVFLSVFKGQRSKNRIGNRQSGENKYISLMLAYPDKYKTAKLIAKDILENEDDCRVLDRVLNMDETV